MSQGTEASIRASRKARAAAADSRVYRDGLGITSKDYVRRGTRKSQYGSKLSEKY
jgi:hypothetical protein